MSPFISLPHDARAGPHHVPHGTLFVDVGPTIERPPYLATLHRPMPADSGTKRRMEWQFGWVRWLRCREIGGNWLKRPVRVGTWPLSLLSRTIWNMDHLGLDGSSPEFSLVIPPFLPGPIRSILFTLPSPCLSEERNTESNRLGIDGRNGFV